MTPLRQRFIEEMTRRNLAPRTIATYVSAVARTAKHFNRSPDLITPDQLRNFQLHLIAHSASWSLFNQITCALRFLYHHVLDRPDFVPFVVYGKKPRTLPTILSPAEVLRLLDAVPRGRNRLMLRITYGCGLRVSELTHLRVADVDGQRKVLWVRQGKGNKDRGLPLPTELIEELRTYWCEHRPANWLFAGPLGQPLHVATVQRFFQKARSRAGLTKPATCHTLRHCYATHLLEAGTDLPTLQRLLGHSHISTTMRYLHLRSERLPELQSPLALLGNLATSAADGTARHRSGGRSSSVLSHSGEGNSTDGRATPRAA